MLHVVMALDVPDPKRATASQSTRRVFGVRLASTSCCDQLDALSTSVSVLCCTGGVLSLLLGSLPCNHVASVDML